jgi:hypothetical protein
LLALQNSSGLMKRRKITWKKNINEKRTRFSHTHIHTKNDIETSKEKNQPTKRWEEMTTNKNEKWNGMIIESKSNFTFILFSSSQLFFPRSKKVSKSEEEEVEMFH